MGASRGYGGPDGGGGGEDGDASRLQGRERLPNQLLIGGHRGGYGGGGIYRNEEAGGDSQ